MNTQAGLPSRRNFLKAGGAGLLVAATAGCNFLSTDPASKSAGGVSSVPKGKEAPMLARLVKQGKLPPVEQRLPVQPIVLQPVEQMGAYGGTWNTSVMGAADWPWFGRTVGYENLTRWSPDFDEVVPNLATEWSYNDDATELTFELRKGLKWSDGQPFTADDIVFALNDIFKAPEIYPDASSSVPSAEKLSDTSVKLVFQEANALWASYDLLHYQIVAKPKHYLQQFHKKYNPDVDALAEREGYDSWVAMLDAKAGITDSALYWQNPDIPTMCAWALKQPLGAGGQVVLERNPYYWKVDPDGSQLPYLDEVVFDVLLDEEVMLTRALNGDFDMHMRHFNTLQNKPVLAQNRQKGNYEFFDGRASEMNTSTIALNLTCTNPVLREVFNNKDFRVGLSHAINRSEIIDVVYQSQGEPWQAAPRRETPFFNEQLAKQYTEYDVDLANQHLERAGYRRDSDGRRVGPNGQPIMFTLEVPSDFRPDIIDSAELVVGYWEKVGVQAELKTVGRDLFYVRKENNQHDANVWVGDCGLRDAMIDPRWYVPTNTGESNYAIPWALWWASDGTDGEKPPAAVQRQYALYRRLRATPDLEEQYDFMRQILEISKDEFMVIGINLSPPSYGIVANNFGNVPTTIYDSSIYNNPAPTNPEQYFIQA